MNIISYIWSFFQKQILGMLWLSNLIEKIINSFGYNIYDNKIAGSIHFFIYDIIKIFTLLSVLIFLVSYIQSFFPPERTKKILGRFNGIFANTLAALLGTITPFCSCSSIPLFIGFTSAGLPVGVTFSFLISSPLVDLASVILLASIFGFRIAFLYVVVGLVLAVVAGTFIEKFKMGKYIESFVRNAGSVDIDEPNLTTKERITYSKDQVIFTVKKVFLYVIIGVLIGATIHNFIPESFIQKVLGDKNPLSVILATIIGIPMYADIFGTLPIAESLFYKGAKIGTILSFMMAVTALSLPSIIMLKKVIKTPLLIFFVFIVSIGIIIIGYLFNIFQSFII